MRRLIAFLVCGALTALAQGPAGSGGSIGPPGAAGATTNPITAAGGADLSLNGGTGTGSGGNVTVGKGSDGRVVITPGRIVSGAYEYVSVNSTTDTAALAGDSFGLRSLFTIDASAVGFHSAAFLGEVYVPATNTVNAAQRLDGVYGYGLHSGTGTLSELNGVSGVISIAGNGNCTECSAFKSEMKLFSGAGQIITARHYYAQPFQNVSGATKPTTMVGFDVADQGIDGGLATNTYAFRSLGSTKSLFSGPVTLGSSLTVFGPIASTGTTQSTSTTTGDFVTAGGVGIAKNLNLGGILTIGTTGTTCTGNGIQFGGSTECLFRTAAGQFKFTGGGALTLDMDLKANANATYDIGTTSTRWRQLFLSGLASVGSLIVTSPSVPASASATGTTGTIAWDTGFIYIATATNTWKRAAIVTW